LVVAYKVREAAPPGIARGSARAPAVPFCDYCVYFTGMKSQSAIPECTSHYTLDPLNSCHTSHTDDVGRGRRAGA
jgi:hypothetical protein